MSSLNILITAKVDVGWGGGLAPVPTWVKDGDVAKVVLRPELVVAITEVVCRVGGTGVFEASGVPVLVNGVMELAKIELAVVTILLLEVLPVAQTTRQMC